MSLILFAPLFLAAFAAIWLGILFLLSRMSGWNRLHAAYPHDGTPMPVRRVMQSASMGYSPYFPVRFRSVLTLGTDGIHLYLRPGFLFGVMHPALAIPMSEIRAEHHRGILGQLLHLRTSREPGIVIILHERLTRWLIENGARGLAAQIPDMDESRDLG
ncbi:MAG: hypothetical protein R3C13_09190 [Hyphomonas sp.]|uniref:hypothetical protein n=1 Tax=Hyphomonas sp. TaxID=87 RepID=UPI003529ABCA